MDTPRKLLGKTATVDKSIVFPSLGLTVPTSTLSFEEQHAYVVESVAKHPDRLIGGIALQTAAVERPGGRHGAHHGARRAASR